MNDLSKIYTGNKVCNIGHQSENILIEIAAMSEENYTKLELVRWILLAELTLKCTFSKSTSKLSGYYTNIYILSVVNNGIREKVA